MLKITPKTCRISAVISFLTTVLLLVGCSPKNLQTVRIEAEANQIVDILRENGISAKKETVGEGERKVFVISVNGDDESVSTAIQIMEDHCLPKPEPPEVEGGTVITSIEVERAREQRRLKINIESQLRRLPGATCIDVNFVPPQDRTLAINPYPSTASVVIYYKTATFSVTKEEIAGLVARSVPALQPENVTVVLAAKPLRPLPDNKIAYNFTRIALVSSIGLATILAFVSVVFFLQKKRRKQNTDEENNAEIDADSSKETALLTDKDDFDDDDENTP